MKTASALLQTFALAACLAAQLTAPGEFRIPGMRRALQTMEASVKPSPPAADIAMESGG